MVEATAQPQTRPPSATSVYAEISWILSARVNFATIANDQQADMLALGPTLLKIVSALKGLLRFLILLVRVHRAGFWLMSGLSFRNMPMA